MIKKRFIKFRIHVLATVIGLKLLDGYIVFLLDERLESVELFKRLTLVNRTSIHREQSSMKVRKYNDQPFEETPSGHICLCI